MFSGLAAWIEALGDVQGVVNDVLLVFQTLVFQAGNDLSGCAPLSDGIATELLWESLPQDVPGTVSWIV